MIFLSDKLTNSEAFQHMRAETIGLLCWLLDAGADEDWIKSPRKDMHNRFILDRRSFSTSVEELDALGMINRSKPGYIRVTLEDYDPQYSTSN